MTKYLQIDRYSANLITIKSKKRLIGDIKMNNCLNKNKIRMKKSIIKY
jgi:hypothetical protein